jgi:hypothetical protein
MTQVVECLPSKCEAQFYGLKKKKVSKMIYHTLIIG